MTDYEKILEKRLQDAEKVITFYSKKEHYEPRDYYKGMHNFVVIGYHTVFEDDGKKAREYLDSYSNLIKPDIADFFEKPNKTTNCNVKDVNLKDVVFCGRGKGRCWYPDACVVGEKGCWGNPIVTNKKCLMCRNIHDTPESTLKCYEVYLREKLKNNMIFKKAFFELKGKKLACFCKPNPCHTDIMIKYLDTKTGDMFRSNHE